MERRAVVYFGDGVDGIVLFTSHDLNTLVLPVILKDHFYYRGDKKAGHYKGFYMWEGEDRTTKHKPYGALRSLTGTELELVMAGTNPLRADSKGDDFYKQRCEYLEKKFAELLQAVQEGEHGKEK